MRIPGNENWNLQDGLLVRVGKGRGSTFRGVLLMWERCVQ